jgi:hypothetical protein
MAHLYNPCLSPVKLLFGSVGEGKNRSEIGPKTLA